MLRSVKFGIYGAVLAGVVGGSAAWHAVDKSVTLYVDGHATSVHTTASDVAGVLASAGYRAGAHDLLAPSAHSSVQDGSTVIYKRGRLLRLDVDGVSRDVWTTAPTVAVALNQLGMTSGNYISVSRSTRLPLHPTDIAIRTPHLVQIRQGGTTNDITTTAQTVGQLIDQLGIQVGSSDRVSVAMGDALDNGMVIGITRVHEATVSAMRTVPYQTTRVKDGTLTTGLTKVVTPGRNGLVQINYAAVYVDGKLTGKKRIDTVTVRPATARVEKVGTKPLPATFASGTRSGSSSRSDGTSTTRAAPIAVTPGSAQDIARAMLADRGMGEVQFGCLVEMWNHESGWRVDAYNAGSGAYGIPQSLPGSKMASAGADWRTNPATQITWGLDYIASRYGTPCGAWAAWQAHGGWYY